MKNILIVFLFLSLFISVCAQQPCPGPGWSTDSIKQWCMTGCLDCRNFDDTTIRARDGSYLEITFTTGCQIKCRCAIDSNGRCVYYEERWPSPEDTTALIEFFSDTALYRKLEGNQWSQRLYGRNKKPLVGCCVYWSLRSDSTYNGRGALLAGELRRDGD